MALSTDEQRTTQLRNWYLARLRKRAFAGSRDLTPLTLIEADRQFIEALIAESAATVKPKPVDTAAPYTRWWLMIWLIAFGTGTCALFISAGDGGRAAAVLYQLTVGLLLFRPLDTIPASAPMWLILLPATFYGLPFAGSILSCAAIISPPARRVATPILVSLAALLVVPILATLVFLTIQAGSEGNLEQGLTWVAGICSWQMIIGTVTCQLFQRNLMKPLDTICKQVSVISKSSPTNLAPLQQIEASLSKLSRRNQELESRERLIAEAADEIICMFNADLRIASINTSAGKLLGYLAGELIGRSVIDLALPGDVERSTLAFSRIRAERESSTFENRVLSKSGRAVDLSWTAEWSETENCYFACARDISDHKTLERAKREFVAMIGHDIKVPVGSALLGVQSLAEGACGDVSQPAVSMLVRIEASLRRLISLLNELLEYEKASAGKLDLALEEVSLLEVLKAALGDVSDLAAKKEVTISRTVPDIRILADRGKLTRVLLNLISNAIKFSPNRSTITITAKEDTNFVELRVSDNGPGIAPEYQQLVFERYERVDAESSAIEGTGLGLAIARAIVESHSGTIGVESQPGNGATFWITLPALPDEYEI